MNLPLSLSRSQLKCYLLNKVFPDPQTTSSSFPPSLSQWNCPAYLKLKFMSLLALWEERLFIQNSVPSTKVSALAYGKSQPAHSEGDQPWVLFGRNDAKAETPILWPPHWKRLWCWEGLGAGGEGDDRGWDGWMASPTRWTWVWVNSRSWWWTGRPGMLWFMGSQKVGHNWATELKPSFISLNLILSEMILATSKSKPNLKWPIQ